MGFLAIFVSSQKDNSEKGEIMSDKVLNLTTEDFDETVKQDKAVLVDFWASWCGPCKMIAPVLDELAEEYGDQAVIAKVDVEKFPELAKRFGVTSIPNLKIFRNDLEKKSILGAVPKNTIKAAIDQVI